MSIEAMKQALEALEANVGSYHPLRRNAITSLRQAIAEAEKQEPLGYLEIEDVEAQREYPHHCRAVNLWYEGGDYMVAVYNNPQPKREWVGLTKQEIRAILESNDWTTIPARLIWEAEAKLKEKNT